MKKDTHPKYYDQSDVTCSCGAVLKTGSTQEKMSVEICSQCHPFYTGKKKVVDTTGRVDRFKKISERAKAKKASTKKTTDAKKKREIEKEKKEAKKKK